MTGSWYRVRITHGPGHQGTHIEWVWWGSSEPPSEEEKREWFNDIASREFMNYPIGKVVKMELPEEVRLEKVEEYKAKIEGAKYMLEVLGEKTK